MRTLELSEKLGVSLRQLQWWDEKAIISPAQNRHSRDYDDFDIVAAALVADLRRKYVALRICSAAVKALRKQPNALWIIVEGEKCHAEQFVERVISLAKSARGPVYVVAIRRDLA